MSDLLLRDVTNERDVTQQAAKPLDTWLGFRVQFYPWGRDTGVIAYVGKNWMLEENGHTDTTSIAVAVAPARRWKHGVEREMSETGGERVSSTLRKLRESGKIGDAEVWAAERFYRDTALAEGARDPEAKGSGGGMQAYSAAQLDAVTGCRRVVEMLGPWAEGLLRLAVVDEASCRAIAERTGTNDQFIGGMLSAALRFLAHHYTVADHFYRRRRFSAA
jgi:hypothetical protein